MCASQCICTVAVNQWRMYTTSLTNNLPLLLPLRMHTDDESSTGMQHAATPRSTPTNPVLLQDMVVDYIATMTMKAQQNATLRGGKMGLEDLLFQVRKVCVACSIV